MEKDTSPTKTMRKPLLVLSERKKRMSVKQKGS